MELCGVSIAKNSNINKVFLADISKEALDVCSRNIELNNVCNKCQTILSNIFNNIEISDFEMLVSNPPYIKRDVLQSLDESVKHEPILALDGGIDGLKVYTKILDEAQSRLKDMAPILFEIGYDQKQDLINLLSKYDCYEYIECIKDIEKRDRVIVCRFHQI